MPRYHHCPTHAIHWGNMQRGQYCSQGDSPPVGIERYVKGKTFDDLLADDMMYYAVVKNIEMMGEAANMLTADFQSAHPETPWKMVKGMRNYIVHEYFQIDNVVVWDVVTKELAPLRKQIEKYLTETDWEQWEQR